MQPRLFTTSAPKHIDCVVTHTVHGQLSVTRTSTTLLAALLSTWVTQSMYWYRGLFLPRCWTLDFYLLNSMRFLSAHFLSLPRSFYMAAWPGFTCFGYLVNSALKRCSFSDWSSTAEQTNFSQSQQVSKTLDKFASPYRLYHTKLFNISFLQENLSERASSLKVASNQGAYEFHQKLTYFSLVHVSNSSVTSHWSASSQYLFI